MSNQKSIHRVIAIDSDRVEVIEQDGEHWIYGSRQREHSTRDRAVDVAIELDNMNTTDFFNGVSSPVKNFVVVEVELFDLSVDNGRTSTDRRDYDGLGFTFDGSKFLIKQSHSMMGGLYRLDKRGNEILIASAHRSNRHWMAGNSADRCALGDTLHFATSLLRGDQTMTGDIRFRFSRRCAIATVMGTRSSKADVLERVY